MCIYVYIDIKEIRIKLWINTDKWIIQQQRKWKAIFFVVSPKNKVRQIFAKSSLAVTLLANFVKSLRYPTLSLTISITS